MGAKKYIWMEIDLNNNELPIAVADTAGELAELRGVKEQTIYTKMYEAKVNGEKCKYIRVENDDVKEYIKDEILTPKKVDWAYKKWCEGYTLDQIASALNVSMTPLRKKLSGKKRIRPVLIYKEED